MHEDMGFCDMITKFTIQLKCEDFFQDSRLSTMKSDKHHSTFATPSLAQHQRTFNYSVRMTTLHVFQEVILKPRPALVLTVIEKKGLTLHNLQSPTLTFGSTGRQREQPRVRWC
jgi:hypothetical protein